MAARLSCGCGGVPYGEVGELISRISCSFDGYSENREKTAAPGFRLGDMVRRDEQGFIYLRSISV
jgi:non-ribosomal peptide synthetase component E (peptide arylation enzyme)